MGVELEISTTSRQLADALLSASIPDAKQTEVRKHAADLERVFHIVIHFASTVGVGVLVNLLSNAITKPGNENTKINNRPIQQNIVYINNLIVNEIQRHERKKPPEQQAHEEAD